MLLIKDFVGSRPDKILRGKVAVRCIVDNKSVKRPENIMSNPPEVQNDEHRLNDKPFSAMTAGERVRFLGKVFVFLVSGGFIYPSVWVE